ncbi:MAG: 2-amino-4-hydroxy-6-hydroxymethyldihydropteridine diphosphokinase [Anaerolineales bacterium]
MRDQKSNNKTTAKNQVYLGLGSNIDPGNYILKAVELLRSLFFISDISNAWESFPVGTTGPKFVNVALSFKTDLSLEMLKNEVLRPIENQLGRVRTSNKNAPRTIDLDILIWNDRVIDPELVYHPHLAVPFAEINPEFKPFGKSDSIKEIAESLNSNKALVNCPEISQKIKKVFSS